ncbi:hypothetical protein [Stenotrophomonas phage IME-SM1]|uniref:Uncharacterized protein n=1 Tax=Stenotrophomonas phage IME-SM1 TaxID=1654717 RepID=A0A0H4J2F6_9CAUD|nr:hypothetical protein KMC40_gp195 [Stenotrophomonas phage IME-SM1]AKO61563.1 hypothetical protein [Stenotrophomonas phage IME-SM1]
MSTNTTKTDNTTGYVGKRISTKQYKQWLARASISGATNPPEKTAPGERHGIRFAIQDLVIGKPLQFVPKSAAKVVTEADKITAAVKGK